MSDNPYDQIDPPASADRVTKLLGKVRSLEGSGDKAISPKGASGRYQITKDTADRYGIDYNRLSNPDYAERSARRILGDLTTWFKDDSDVLIAYNAGPGRAGKPIDQLPGETQQYLAHNARLDGKNPFDVLDPPKTAKGPQKAVYDPAKFQRKPGAPPPPQIGPAHRATLSSDYRGETAQAYNEGVATANRNQYDPKQGPVANALRFGAGLGGVFDAAMAPVAGVGRTIIKEGQRVTDALTPAGQHYQSDEGKEAERAFGGAVATSAIPIGGDEAAASKLAERAAARLTEKARMAAPVSKHAAKVERLTQEGVQLTPGMRAGGEARTAEEARKSSPYVGGAIEQGERKAVESVNRAAYNRVLKPLGETYTGPVGREGIGHIQDRLSAAYDRILPQVTARADDDFGQGLAKLQDRVNKLGPAERSRFDAIAEQDVHRFFNEGGGQIDGRTFKNIESELGRQSRGMKGDPSYKERELGHLVDDLNDLVRDSAERHSPPGVRQKLKDVNTGYAMFTRIQDAAARRVGAEDGVFNTGDLMAAVKKGDRSVRKGSFARGDALLQGFAEDAHSVVRAKLPDSGTARRVKQGLAGRTLGGIVGAAAGSHAGLPGEALGGAVGAAAGNAIDAPIAAATNALARHHMERLARASSRSPQNYLKTINSRVSPFINHRPGAAVGGVNMLRQIAQPPQQ